jgi:hypothetical protein
MKDIDQSVRASLDDVLQNLTDKFNSLGGKPLFDNSRFHPIGGLLLTRTGAQAISLMDGHI